MKKTVLYIILLITPALLWAQSNYYNNRSGGNNTYYEKLLRGYLNNGSSYGYGNSYTSNSFRFKKNYYKDRKPTYESLGLPDTSTYNECGQFFFGYDDSTNISFKTVTVEECRSDTFMHKGFELDKQVYSFNKKGQMTSKVTIIDNEPTYRITYAYDSHNRITDEEEFSGDNGKLKKTTGLHNVYDANGKLMRTDETEKGGILDNSTRVTYYTYNNLGYLIQTKVCGHVTLEGKDTTITNILYDNNNRIIFIDRKNNSSTYYNSITGNIEPEKHREYYAYDIVGRPILEAKMSNYDSTSTVTTFDDSGTIVAENKYEYSKMLTSYSRKPTLDGHFTEVYEEMSTAEANMCPNNVVTLMVVDSDDNILSKTETRLNEGKPVVTTTTHVYQFTPKKKLIVDTSVMILKGHLYAMRSQEVIKYTRNQDGKVTEMDDESGGDYNTNWKYTCKYDDNDNMIDYSQFNACDDFKPQQEYMYSYYPGTHSVKQVQTSDYSKRYINTYGPDQRVLSSYERPISHDENNSYGTHYYEYAYDNGNKYCTLTVYSYEEWGR